MRNSGIAENKTLIPKTDANMMDENPSKMAFVISKSDEKPIPS